MSLILNTSIIGLLLLLLYYYFHSKKTKIAIVGQSGAGKTRYFHDKVGKTKDVYTTSLVINSQVVNDVEWIDVPGNDKIFKSCWDSIKNEITNVDFLIDSVGFYKERKQVAKRLYQVSRDFKGKIRIILSQIHDNRALEKEKIHILLQKELKELQDLGRKNVGVEQDLVEENDVDFYILD